ncbi:hypothetical protein GCM10010271_71220 [Streptomyces kurssanovii]|nr:hypothetical protein GCM10010271_71220 [Streptomyces kurssanovii]
MARSPTGPTYVALAVTVEGRREILGLWAGDGGEGAKRWLHILTEIKNRGVSDVLMLVCDGLKGLPEAVETVWPRTIVQTCVVHLLRNSLRYAARQDWDKIAKLLKPVYTAPTEEAALERFAEFADAWGRKYPAIVKLWENAWEEFTPFLRFDTEIRRIVCTTNAIESVNARIRRAVKACGHFPNEQAALKCVYMAIMLLDPTGKGQARWTMRWKTALNAFDITSTAACRQPASHLNCLSCTGSSTDPPVGRAPAVHRCLPIRRWCGSHSGLLVAQARRRPAVSLRRLPGPCRRRGRSAPGFPRRWSRSGALPPRSSLRDRPVATLRSRSPRCRRLGPGHHALRL